MYKCMSSCIISTSFNAHCEFPMSFNLLFFAQTCFGLHISYFLHHIIINAVFFFAVLQFSECSASSDGLVDEGGEYVYIIIANSGYINPESPERSGFHYVRTT